MADLHPLSYPFGCYVCTRNLPEMLIEVFKTKVSHHLEALMVSSLLKEVYPAYSINFDLEDCDKIMRIKSKEEPIRSKDVVKLLNRLGFYIEILENDQPLLNGNPLNHGTTNLCTPSGKKSW